MLGVWLRHVFSIKDLIVLNPLRLQRERDVGVGQRRYYVSSDVEWSTVVLGHRGVEVKEEVLGGGGGKQKEKEQSEINCLSCARSHTLILSCFCVQSTASPFTFN